MTHRQVASIVLFIAFVAPIRAAQPANVSAMGDASVTVDGSSNTYGLYNPFSSDSSDFPTSGIVNAHKNKNKSSADTSITIGTLNSPGAAFVFTAKSDATQKGDSTKNPPITDIINRSSGITATS